MKSLITEKKKSIELRKLGFTYNEIRQRVQVSKSSLSLWLRDVGLFKKQIQRITERRRNAQKRAVEIIKQRRIEKTLMIKNNAAKEIGRLTDREIWFMGIALYWAEGSKERDRGKSVIFSNSDPAMIVFFRKWLLDYLNIAPYDLIYELYIHAHSNNISQAIKFWCNLLEIEPHELRVRLKKHNLSPKRKNINYNYKGLIRIYVRRSVDLNRKISGWTNGIITNYIGE